MQQAVNKLHTASFYLL